MALKTVYLNELTLCLKCCHYVSFAASVKYVWNIWGSGGISQRDFKCFGIFIKFISLFVL